MMNIRYHIDLIYRDFEDAVVDFDWHSKHTRQALKTALACTLSIIICNFLVIPYAYWAGISTLIMMQPHVGASLNKGWMRFGGAAIGCLLSLPFAGLTAQNPMLFSSLTVLVVATGFYLGQTSRYGYFWSYMCCHIVLIGMLAVLEPHGVFPEHIAFFRAAAILVGVCCSLVVNVVLWPDFLLEEIQAADRKLKSSISLYLSHCFSALREDRYDRQLFRDEIEECLTLIDQAGGMIKGVFLEQRLFHDNIVLSTINLESLKSALEEYHTWFVCVMDSREKMGEIISGSRISRLNRLLSELIGAHNDEPEKVKRIKAELEESFENVEKLMLGDKQAEDVKAGKLLVLFEGFYAMRQMFYVFADQKVARVNVGRSVQHADDVWVLAVGKLNWPVHIPSLKYSLKGGLAFITLFWVWLFFQIPCSAMAMSLAVVTVLQMDLMMTWHKGILRMAGCALGAALGLTWLFCGIEAHLFTFMTLFGVIACLAYIWGSKPGVAYIGAQAGIAYLVAVVHDFGPTESIGPPLQRLLGIVLGVLCVWLINMLLWPEDLLEHYQKQIKNIEQAIRNSCKSLEETVLKGTSMPGPCLELDWASLNSNLKTLKEQQELSPDAAVDYVKQLTDYESLYRKIRYLNLHWNHPFAQKMKRYATKIAIDSQGLLEAYFTQKPFQEWTVKVSNDIERLDSIWPILFKSDYFSNLSNREKFELLHFIIVVKRFLKRLMNLSSVSKK